MAVRIKHHVHGLLAAAVFLVTGYGHSHAAGPAVLLSFSTYLGPDAATQYSDFRGVSYDSAGNILLSGTVKGIPTTPPYGYPSVPVTVHGSISDGDAIILMKLTSSGQPLWVTLIGGNGLEKEGQHIVEGPAGNLYVAGTTFSTDFPTTPGAFDRTENGITPAKADMYLLKLTQDGKTLLFSTYLGGSEDESARGKLTVDSQGNAYIAGRTGSADFLENASSGRPANKVNSFIGGFNDGAVIKVAPDGASIVWMRHLGSPTNTTSEGVLGIGFDASGNIYTSGVAAGNAFTTDGSSYHGGEQDFYVTKLSPNGIQLLYAILIGGSGNEGGGHNMAPQGDGTRVIGGTITSTDFPIVNGHQASFGGSFDGILAQLDPNGQIVWSTYIGKSQGEINHASRFDSQGNIWVIGRTFSSNFEVTQNPFDSTYNGGNGDGFFQMYSPAGSLLYSSLVGGGDYDYGRGLNADKQGSTLFLIETKSGNFPTTAGAYDRTYNGGKDCVLMKFDVQSMAVQDSNGDGISDVDAIAIGLDPTDPDGDTDNDGITDVIEVGGNVNIPLDSDGDGVIDALEPGIDATDAMVASGLRLTSGDTVSITTAAGETLSMVSVADATGGPSGVNFTYGSITYNTTALVNASVTIRMIFSSNLPANLAIYKVDNTNKYTELPTTIWTRVDARTVDITLTDGGSLTDLDNASNNSISDPVALGEVVSGGGGGAGGGAGGGGGGGGCTVNTKANVDPVWPLILIVSAIGYLRKRVFYKNLNWKKA